MKKILLMLFLCGTFSATFAQETLPSSSFLAFLHGGYGFLPDKTSGLTGSSAKYVDELSSGAAWNAQAYYRSKMFIVGLLYSGYTAGGSLENSSDKILTTYLAPQLGMCIPIGESFGIAFNGGFGGMWLRNNGTVYEKDRIATGSTLGINLGVKGIYNFSKHFGLSLELLGISANLHSYDTKYHDQTLKVRCADALHLNQLTFSLGLKYSL